MPRVFVSYSHHDRRWVDRGDPHTLIPFLADSLKREGVEIWHDHALAPGDVFRAVIEERIGGADLAILLVSQHFLNSDFIRDVELPLIERRAAAGALRIIPILVEPCSWQELKVIGDRQMVPGGPRPLIEFLERDADWAHVRHEILQAVKRQVTSLHGREPPVAPPPATPSITLPRRRRPRRSLLVFAAGVVILGGALGLLPRVLSRGARGTDAAVAPVNARATVPAAELAALEERIAGYRDQIRDLPFAASAFESELKPVAERLWSERTVGPDAARAVATTYRLYAASILMSPTGTTLAGLQSAAPWVRRAIELYPGFADRAELEEASRFLMDLLIRQPAQIEMKELLSREIRIAMVEAEQAEVDRQVETAFGMIKELMEQRNR